MSQTNIRSGSAVGKWPAEERLVVELLRHALGTATKQLVWPENLNPGRFQACVGRHRAGAFLHHRLAVSSVENIPSKIRDGLREHAEQTTKRALQRSVELIRVAKIFQQAGIPFLSFKGPLLAHDLYGTLGERHAGDIDLLMAADHVGLADKCLRAAGWRRTEPSFELTPRQWREYQQVRHEFEYFQTSTDVRLEIAWRLNGFQGQTADELLKQSRQVVMAGTSLHRLPKNTEFLYLFVHGAGHRWFRLFWLVDVAQLLLRNDIDWAALKQIADQNRVERCLWQGSQLASELFGIPLPEALKVPKSEANRIGQLALDGLDAMNLPDTERPDVAELFRDLRYLWCLRPDWPSRSKIFKARLNSPDNWETLRLPDRWFGLYYVVFPLLWVKRRIKYASSTK
jgi:hypothetical protein